MVASESAPHGAHRPTMVLPRRCLTSLAAAFTETRRRLARPIARATARSCIFETAAPTTAAVGPVTAAVEIAAEDVAWKNASVARRRYFAMQSTAARLASAPS